MNAMEIKALTEVLKQKLKVDYTKVRYDRKEKCWEVFYEEGEFEVTDSYYLTVDSKFKLVSTIRTEI